ncbi:sulfatase (plasmid) [Salinigranum rubrum]|uniref:Sulfatase n=1 Tax=Salinigranum rubrum TaxID=755307 RepID=A0A2I8VQI8_9EURY|nr:sulfatase-like hydrolase/transferase [Salinigranum rubrum]AUV84144.1 sulfatase [Salinigranum rubrum]
MLGEREYETAGVSTVAYMGPATGLDRGFDQFQYIISDTLREAVHPTDLIKYLLRIRRHGGGLTADTTKHSTSYLVNETVKRAFNQHSSRDNSVFVYAHYNDTHHPYTPPLPFLDRYTSNLSISASEARDVAIRLTENLNEFVSGAFELTEVELNGLIAMYDATIAYVDKCIGELIEWVRSRTDNTVVVVTGDHGELFGERGLYAHKLVTHDAVSHVPMIVAGPTDVTEYEGDLIQPIDVVRTLLAEVGADQSTLQGIDLRHETRDYCFIQRGGSRVEQHLEWFDEYAPEFNPQWLHRGDLTAIRTTTHKYEKSDSRTVLYELPDEETNVVDNQPIVADRLNDELTAFWDTLGRPYSNERRIKELPPSARQSLRNMGYLVD